jgi:hypothetical protein
MKSCAWRACSWRASSCAAVALVWLMLPGGGRLVAEEPAPDVGRDTLEDLEWMIGEWLLVPEDDAETKHSGTMTMTVRWDDGRAFIVREATLTPPAESGEPVVTLQQRIGWDPLVDRIRSWSFSSDGSRAEATWFEEAGSWIVRGTAVLPDGTQASSTNIYTFDGQDRCAWRIVRPPLATDDSPPTRATWVRKPRSTTP